MRLQGWGKSMPKKVREPSAMTQKSYAPPSLTIYGGMASLTASGTVGVAESMATDQPTKAMV